MLWRLKILTAGFLFIFLGIILLWSTGTTSGGDVFFVFPFFYGGSDILGLVVLFALALVFFAIVAHVTSTFVLQANTRSYFGKANDFIPMGSRCRYCSKPMPMNSSFCPFCGSPTEQNDTSNERI
jgi:hypothetical protein